EIGEVGRQLVDRRGVRMAELRAHASGEPGAHAGGADVDHYRRLQLVDHLEQRVVAPVVHGEVLHDRMEMKAEKAELPNSFSCLSQSKIAFRRLERAP